MQTKSPSWLLGLAIACATGSTLASENPFQARLLPQGYMLIAENSLPEPPPPPDKALSTTTTSPQMQSSSMLKPQTKPITDIKSSKMQDGGCGAGSCAAKLNKAKGQNAAK